MLYLRKINTLELITIQSIPKKNNNNIQLHVLLEVHLCTEGKGEGVKSLYWNRQQWPLIGS